MNAGAGAGDDDVGELVEHSIVDWFRCWLGFVTRNHQDMLHTRTLGQHIDQSRHQLLAHDHQLGVSLGHAVLHPLLPQVGVDGHHGQAVLERGNHRGHPLRARVGVQHDLVLGLDTQLSQTLAKTVRLNVHLLIVDPLVLSQLILSEHLAVSLLLLQFSQDLSCSKSIFGTIFLQRIVPNLLQCCDLVGVRLQLVLDGVDHGHCSDGDLVGLVRHDPGACLPDLLCPLPWLLNKKIDWIGDEVPNMKKNVKNDES